MSSNPNNTRALRRTVDALKGALEQLTHAGDGLDRRLDDELGELRRLLSHGTPVSQLDLQIATVTERMQEITARVNRAREGLRPPLEDLLSMLGEAPINRSLTKRGNALRERLDDDFTEPEELWDEALEYVGQILNALGSPGLLERLVGRHRRESEPQEAPRAEAGPVPDPARTALLSLLDAMSVPDTVAERADALRNRLTDDVPMGELARVIQSVVDLVSDATREENETLERFLTQLSDRIQSLESILSESNELVDGAQTERRALDDAIRDNVAELRTHMGEATSIGQLSQLLEGTLSSIIGRLDRFMEAQAERERQTQSHIDNLQNQLGETESQADALRRSLVQQRMRAQIDPLTQIANREAYDQRLEYEYSRWARYESPLAISFADVDHFKRINDQFGHAVGDKVLQTIAKTLASNLRKSDLVARYGGEEFVVLMPETDEKRAQKVAEKLKRAVEAQPFYSGQDRVPVTMSFGVTTFQPRDTPDDALERADQALYRSKDEGRNRVTLDSGA